MNEWAKTIFSNYLSLDVPTTLVVAAVVLLLVVYSPRRARAGVIWIGQCSSFIGIALAVAVAGRAGYSVGLTMAQTTNEWGQLYCALAGAVLGGIVGLVASSLLASMFFVLLDIRENTRGWTVQPSGAEVIEIVERSTSEKTPKAAEHV